MLDATEANNPLCNSADRFDHDTINFLTVGSGLDNNTDQTTSNNQTITLAANNEVLNVTGNT